MTIHADEASRKPLITDDDKVTRIRDLIAPASNPSQLWVMLLSEAGVQHPLIIPLDDRPTFPEPALVDGLLAALSDVVRDETSGRGQVMFVLERFGPLGAMADDHCWAAALSGASQRAGIAYAGTFLLNRAGVIPVAA